MFSYRDVVAFTYFLFLIQLPSGTGSLRSPVLSCFLQNESLHRPSHGQFTGVDVDPVLCKHVVYSYAVLDARTNRIRGLHPVASYNGSLKRLVDLKQSNPALVVSVAVDGREEESVKYSKMAATKETRKIFVESTVQFLRTHSLDGLNMDWQYPNARGSSDFDKQNYVSLCKDLSDVFRPRGWHLTVKVPVNQHLLDRGYNLQELSKYVDLVYVRSTDYHYSVDGSIEHVAIDGGSLENSFNSTLSFLLSRVPLEKLAVTVPLDARTHHLSNTDTNYGTPRGFSPYNKICELLTSEEGKRMAWRSATEGSSNADIMDKRFSYNDNPSIYKKVEVDQAFHLSDVSIKWMEYEDFRQSCNEGHYLLPTHIKNTLMDEDIVTLEDPSRKRRSSVSASEQTGPVKACFLASESVQRASLGKFNIQDIDPSLCTHVVFCYAVLNENTGGIDDRDPVYVDDGAYERLVALKERNPRLVVLVGIGGWEDGALKYSTMAATARGRAKFVQSVVAYLRSHSLDGLNIDWQDPATRGGIELDKQNYVLLCQELRKAFEPHGWQLTVTVSAHKHVIDAGYDLPALATHADLMFVATYAYHGPWEGFTGHTAPLYARDGETPDQRFLNMNFTLSYILSQGVPAHKVVPAIPFIFRTYTLTNESDNGVGAPSTDEGFRGPYTNTFSAVAYYEICNNVWQSSSWKIRVEPQQRVPYMVHGDKWVGYEDNDSIREKVTLAASLGLAGVMVWTVDGDDFGGLCGHGPYPLLAAVNREMTHVAGHFGGTPGEEGGGGVPPTLPSSAAPAPHEGPFLFPPAPSSAPHGRCSVVPLEEVSVDVLTCGQDDSSCTVDDTVPVHTVVYAVCWDTVSLVLRCHPDGYWRPYSESSPGQADARDGQEDKEGRMRLICQPHYVNSPVCGQRPRYQSTGGPLSLGTFFAPVDRQPWLVDVVMEGHHSCVGTLVSSQHVLTAAHCVASNVDGAVIAGSLEVQIESSVNVKVTEVKVNPDYSHVQGKRHSNDIALLRLEQPLRFHSSMYPACINFNFSVVSTKHALVFEYVGESKVIRYEQTAQEFDSSCHRSYSPCYIEVEFDRTIFCGVSVVPSETFYYGSPGSPFLQDFGATDSDERWSVSGVVSRVESSTTCTQRVTVLSAVNVYKDWITKVVN